MGDGVFPIEFDKNCGNICFLNASLQALLGNAELRDGILGIDHNLENCEARNQDKNCILCHFVAFLNNHSIQKTSGQAKTDGTSLYHSLEDIHPNLKPGQQQDAHEFLVNFFEKLGKCHTRAEEITKELFDMKCESKVVCHGCNDPNTSIEMCGPCITVDFKDNLEKSLQSCFSTESIKLYCNRCNGTRSASKSLVVHSLPHHLFIQVKRFRYQESTPKKITDVPMVVPEVINSNNICCGSEDSCQYRLSCFIVHIGSTPVEGHYVAYRGCNEKWYRCDDRAEEEPVQEVNVDEKQLNLRPNETIYLLFYKKCDTSLKPSITIKEVLVTGVSGDPSVKTGVGSQNSDVAGIQRTLENTSLHSLGGQNLVQSNTNDEQLVLNVTENKEFPSADVCSKLNPTTIESNYAGEKLICQPENQEISNGIVGPRLESKNVIHTLKTAFKAADIKNSGNNECHIDETTPNAISESRPNRVLREDSEVPSSSRESNDVASNLSSVASLEICIKIETQDADLQERLTKFYLDQYKAEPQVLEQRLKLVLPYGCTLVNVFAGSIILVIQASLTNALEDLWNKYENGQLKDALQNVLITDEVKAEVGAQEIAISLVIKEDRYDFAIKKLQEFQLQAVALQRVVNNPTLMDQLARCLDKQYHVIKYWMHLAHDLGVPLNVSRQFEMSYSGLSPSVQLFEYLLRNKPTLTVGELKEALKRDHRNDIVKLLESTYDVTDLVAEKIMDDAMLLDKVAVALDTGKKPIGNWRSLAAQLKIPRKRIERFEMYSSQNPTAMLFAYLSSFQQNLKVKTLKIQLRKIGCEAAVDVLKKYRDEDLVKKVILPESDVALSLEDMLNHTVPGVGNWRKLAYELGVSESEYDAWDPTANKTVRSPTKLLLEWLMFYKQELTLDVLANALRKINRNDAVQILMNFIPDISKPTGPVKDDVKEMSPGFKISSDLVERQNPPHFSSKTVTQRVQSSTPPKTVEERRALKVTLLPVSIYHKLCMKLDVRRIFYDDFRLLAEKCGIDRDFIESLEQQKEPTNEIINKWTGLLGSQATVGAFIDIVKSIEREDVAQILEDWVNRRQENI